MSDRPCRRRSGRGAGTACWGGAGTHGFAFTRLPCPPQQPQPLQPGPAGLPVPGWVPLARVCVPEGWWCLGSGGGRAGARGPGARVGSESPPPRLNPSVPPPPTQTWGSCRATPSRPWSPRRKCPPSRWRCWPARRAVGRACASPASACACAAPAPSGLRPSTPTTPSNAAASRAGGAAPDPAEPDPGPSSSGASGHLSRAPHRSVGSLGLEAGVTPTPNPPQPLQGLLHPDSSVGAPHRDGHDPQRESALCARTIRPQPLAPVGPPVPPRAWCSPSPWTCWPLAQTTPGRPHWALVEDTVKPEQPVSSARWAASSRASPGLHSLPAGPCWPPSSCSWSQRQTPPSLLQRAPPTSPRTSQACGFRWGAGLCTPTRRSLLAGTQRPARVE